MNLLSHSLVNLRNVQSTILDFCQSLERLLTSFGNLMNPKNLNLDVFHNLNVYIYTHGNINALEYLQLVNCFKIEYFPQKQKISCFWNFLDLSSRNIRSFPSVILKLSNLEYLTIQSCNFLQAIGALLNEFIDLDLFGFSKLRKVDGIFFSPKKIQIFNTYGFKSWDKLPIIEILLCLEKLWAFRYVMIKILNHLLMGRMLII